MREVDVSQITAAVCDMCIESTHTLSEDMEAAFTKAVEEEGSPLGKLVMDQLQENLHLARTEQIPICQDTGMAVVFLRLGQEVHLTGGALKTAVDEGVRRGYDRGYLRKSVVGDPIERVNTGDNTPAVLHCEIVPGDRVEITVAPKGFGSENMSRIYMLKPADGLEGVKNAILSAVEEAGPNACPPMVVGVGIGGTFEKCALMAKHALTRDLREESPIPYVRALEREMLEKINALGIGPGGLGGTTTAMAVNIETYPTHIAGLPVAVNICCHVNRHAHLVLKQRSFDTQTNSVTIPSAAAEAGKLRIGDYVCLTGTIYSARDAAHQRMQEALDRGEELPFPVKGSVIYYMGPTPARPGRPIGSAGPTTASRMDKYTPRLLDLGMAAMVGKGRRSPAVLEAVVRNNAVYFAAVGGAGAVLSHAIRSAEVIAYPDLGPEAVHRLEVVDFPVIVVADAHGGDLYTSAVEQYRKKG